MAVVKVMEQLELKPGNYKLTVNKAAKLEIYPLPCIEDLLVSLSRGKSFSTSDLTHANLQVCLAELQQCVTVNTHMR